MASSRAKPGTETRVVVAAIQDADRSGCPVYRSAVRIIRIVRTMLRFVELREERRWRIDDRIRELEIIHARQHQQRELIRAILFIGHVDLHEVDECVRHLVQRGERQDEPHVLVDGRDRLAGELVRKTDELVADLDRSGARAVARHTPGW